MRLNERLLYLAVLPVFLLSSGLLFSAEQSTHIYITDIQREMHENWLHIPYTVDMTVYWEYYREGRIQQAGAGQHDMTNFRLVCFEAENPDERVVSDEIQGNFYTIEKQKVGKRYGIYVEGYDESVRSVVSDTAWIVSGRQLSAGPNPGIVQWHHWLPVNGRIPMAVIGRATVFDGATKAGKLAFHIIWNALLAGTIIWLFFCTRILSLRRIFPMSGNPFQMYRSFNDAYQGGISGEFKEILQEWRNLVDRHNDYIRKEIIAHNLTKVDEIEAANVKFWKEEGSAIVHGLLERTSNPHMSQFPTVRIIQAGLENHELGGYRWLEVSKEVDRAIENRAFSEQESLRRRSLLDWLWNLGTLSPLVGLFGTATGISHSFGMLTMLDTDMTQTALVIKLAGGIFEALWTTIEGLFVGIFMMLLYFFFQNKLNWIYSKWEELYVYVAEKL